LRFPRSVAHGDRAGTAGARVRSGSDHDGADRRLRSGDARRNVVQVENPAKLPDTTKVEEIREPIITITVFVPQDYLGNVITLCNQKRGNQVDMTYHGRQVQLVYEMPMAEVVMDFFDKLKSVSRGYASLDYDFKEFRAADVVKLDILINGEKVDALSMIVHRANSVYRGRELAAKMRQLIPRQMYDVAIQAAIGSNIIARENVKAMRKDVLAKCYGGDITRKKKLLEKQKAGKKRMKQVGSVEIPQEAFLAVLRVGNKELRLNFALILFCLLLASGAIWAADVFVFAKLRRRTPRILGGSSTARAFSRSSCSFLLCVLCRRAVQDPFGFDDSNAAGRRFHSGQQVHVWYSPAGHQQEDH
jgi:hypothetical protein